MAETTLTIEARDDNRTVARTTRIPVRYVKAYGPARPPYET